MWLVGGYYYDWINPDSADSPSGEGSLDTLVSVSARYDGVV